MRSSAFSSLWEVAKALQIPIDPDVKEIRDLPYTISYAIRKRSQIDNLNELPKEKRPPEDILWDGTSEELEKWLNDVLDIKKKDKKPGYIYLDDVEG